MLHLRNREGKGGEPPREGGKAPANLTAEENNLIRVIWKIG